MCTVEDVKGYVLWVTLILNLFVLVILEGKHAGTPEMYTLYTSYGKFSTRPWNI